jgi:hypothetical protein
MTVKSFIGLAPALKYFRTNTLAYFALPSMKTANEVFLQVDPI